MYVITLKSNDNNYFEYKSEETVIENAIKEALQRIKEKAWDRYGYVFNNVRVCN